MGDIGKDRNLGRAVSVEVRRRLAIVRYALDLGRRVTALERAVWADTKAEKEMHISASQWTAGRLADAREVDEATLKEIQEGRL